MAPDFALVHQELKRAGVTLMLLWEEYATGSYAEYRVGMEKHRQPMIQEAIAKSPEHNADMARKTTG